VRAAVATPRTDTHGDPFKEFRLASRGCRDLPSVAGPKFRQQLHHGAHNQVQAVCQARGGDLELVTAAAAF